ncbi:methyltransferase domain-containing protein [Tersicoccus phoenicis]|uniref:methyltransferase domain-containing protein n=1 Tax=Tersicoccus phoenicis TaxID=554083 RepID=UPI002286FC3F|nr:methyltransferase domain-containing protein [Tersicoccus phoenicis]
MPEPVAERVPGVAVPRLRFDPLLRRRSVDEPELMDDPACDPVALAATYRLFAVVNPLVAAWRPVYRSRLRPVLRAAAATGRTATVLDIGSGGGDVARALARWANRDGIAVTVTASDPDPRAHAWAAAHDGGAGLTYRGAASAELVAAGERFDVVVSNHVLHHLSAGELIALLTDTTALAAGVVVHNDLRRSRTAWLLYWVGTLPVARARTFLRFDGLLSIRRSYRADELAALVPAGWQVRPQRSFRLLTVRHGDGAGAR